MTTHPPSGLSPHDERLHQLVHDLQNCLHVVGLGVEILRDVRHDDARFADMSETVLAESRKGVQLLTDYIRATYAD